MWRKVKTTGMATSRGDKNGDGFGGGCCRVGMCAASKDAAAGKDATVSEDAVGVAKDFAANPFLGFLPFILLCQMDLCCHNVKSHYVTVRALGRFWPCLFTSN